MRLLYALAVLIINVYGNAANAQTGRMIYENYASHVDRKSEVGPIDGESGFGDATDLNSGSTSFYVTVLSVPGNNDLDVSVRYKYTPHSYGSTHGWKWERDVPYLSGEFSSEVGWKVGDYDSPSSLRCSYPGVFAGAADVPNTDGKTGVFTADEFWKGTRLVLPGGAGSLLNALYTPAAVQPASGGPYKWATNDGWFFSCIPLEVGTGEGFVGLAPNGVKYYFNRMAVGGVVDALKKHNDLGQTVLQRRELRIYVSRIVDRFGNYVDFNQDFSSISASDGRSISLSTLPNGASAINHAGRQWNVTSSAPYTVTNPDGSAWRMEVTGPGISETMNAGSTCNEAQRQRLSGSARVSITIPSGAKADFDFEPILRGFSHVPYDCRTPESGGIGYLYVESPNVISDVALVRKTVSGPGLQTYVTLLDYGPTNNCYTGAGSPGTCTATSPTSRTTTVTYANGHYRRYVFGNKVMENQGLLLRIDDGQGGDSPLRTVSRNYALFDIVGSRIAGGTNPYYSFSTYKRSSVSSEEVIQQGTRFSYKVGEFDVLARPVKITRSSTPSP